MKTRYRWLAVFSFLCFTSFPVAIDQNTAEAGNDKFYSGYKAYLKKDFNMALFYWKPLAEAGNPDAQYQLGNMFLNGQGVMVDWSEAGKWFRASAKQGDVGAQYLIGEMHLKGMGMDRNFRKAGTWFKKAAEQGYPDAQFRLGEWYVDGKGGVTNLVLAYVWLKLAGANGIQAGDEKRKQVETRLTVKEIQHADRLAHQWWVRIEAK